VRAGGLIHRRRRNQRFQPRRRGPVPHPSACRVGKALSPPTLQRSDKITATLTNAADRSAGYVPVDLTATTGWAMATAGTIYSMIELCAAAPAALLLAAPAGAQAQSPLFAPVAPLQLTPLPPPAPSWYGPIRPPMPAPSADWRSMPPMQTTIVCTGYGTTICK
jgi:hypothetical protein